MIVETTAVQQHMAKQAAWDNYEDKKNTADRAGWTGGKCPVTEYFGKIAELGAANFMNYDWQQLCLYSPNWKDYHQPDIGDWDVKAGNTFSDKDIAKGVKYILWVTPLNRNETFLCGIPTCKRRLHTRLSGKVAIRGWSTVEDVHLFDDLGGYYRIWGDVVRPVETLPAFDWGVAA